jgi:hypothetical protein
MGRQNLAVIPPTRSLSCDLIEIRDQSYRITECGSCGVLYVVPIKVYDHRHNKGGYNYCPNGHGWGWDKDNCQDEMTRRERDRLKQETARQAEEIERLQRIATEAQGRQFRAVEAFSVAIEARDRARRKARDANKALRRAEKQAAHGICLHCDTSFADLSAHMAQKHPEEVLAADAPEPEETEE